MTTMVRSPAVAGTFYPGDARELASAVDEMMKGAARPREGVPAPKALVVPHAGYVYSGPIAATAYATLAPARGTITRVVLLGPAHRVAFEGLALPDARAMATPLGEVPVDMDAVARIASMPQVRASRAAHAREHSLEVHLPFLQRVLGSFSVVPLAVGDASADDVAEVLEALWGGAETLVVISSDLSHYMTYDEAKITDAATAKSIQSLAAVPTHRACGAHPLNGLMLVARRHGARIERLDLRSSGDTAGGRDEVVGYGAFALREPALTAARGDVLLGLARGAIVEHLGGPAVEVPREPWLEEKGAAFVTLRKGPELHGCIGTIEAIRPLGRTVMRNAVLAAEEDPRSPPLPASEVDDVKIEVSVLTPAERLDVATEDEAIAAVVPGVDGVILSAGGRRGVFLPQVWGSIPEPRAFFRALKEKAGLPGHGWPRGMIVERFHVEKFSEPGYAEE